MPFVYPNGTIHFCSGVNLTPDYNNVLYFTDDNNRLSTFTAHEEMTIYNNMYIRDNLKDGVIKVQAGINLVEKCNYLFFRNNGFDERTYFAFITEIEYINPETTAVRFEIDLHTTYFFDCTVGMCFVEREMAVIDTPGSNLVAENLDIGDYINQYQVVENVNLGVAIAMGGYNDPDTGQPINPSGYINGVYNGMDVQIVPVYANVPALIANYINKLTEMGIADAVLSIFYVPADFVDLVGTYDKDKPPHKEVTVNRPTQLDGYTPINKKLLTYPYTCLSVNNRGGMFATFRWEFLGSTTFNIYEYIGASSEVVCVPQNYKGIDLDFSQRIVSNNFPMCSFNVDSYKAWLAQNKSALEAEQFQVEGETKLSIISGAANVVSGFANGGLWGGAAALTQEIVPAFNTVSNVKETVAKYEDYARKPAQARGNQGGNTMVGLKIVGFAFECQTITYEYAKIIDSYFTMFGYKTNVVKTPNRNQRPHWNYIKCSYSNITGNAPQFVKDAWKQMYANGVTYWNHHSEIGNYTLDNRMQ